jgi:16S rRNA (guanine527-N7)-methyltransferase
MSGTAERLNELLSEAGLAALDPETAAKLSEYVSLILRWNGRVNLTSIREEDGIVSRHIVESIALNKILPATISTLLDFGSGAGLPGIPVALCRPEIQVTLAESQGKKAAFLREAARVLGLSVRVHGGRAETLEERFDCVAMRAVDQMAAAVTAAAALVKPGGLLALMTTEGELDGLKAAAGAEFGWAAEVALPGGDTRVVALGRRAG